MIRRGIFSDNIRFPVMDCLIALEFFSLLIAVTITSGATASSGGGVVGDVCRSGGPCYCTDTSISCRQIDTLTVIPRLQPASWMANITEM